MYNNLLDLNSKEPLLGSIVLRTNLKNGAAQLAATLWLAACRKRVLKTLTSTPDFDSAGVRAEFDNAQIGGRHLDGRLCALNPKKK